MGERRVMVIVGIMLGCLIGVIAMATLPDAHECPVPKKVELEGQTYTLLDASGPWEFEVDEDGVCRAYVVEVR